MDTLNIRTSVRKRDHSNYPLNLTGIVDRDLGNFDQSVSSVREPSHFGLDEHGWFVGNVYGS
jgi:hypothetical protein